VSLGLPTARAYGAPAFPPVPTRAQVCGIRMSFQGLTVDVGAGPIGWFEAALCCLSPAQRQIVYAAKHAAGDTHALVFFSAGVPLYPEANQPYADYQCPNYEANPAAFVALVAEVRQQGFLAAVFLQENQDVSTRLLPIAVKALQGAAVRDLTQDAIFVPGFDGVFYGWTPEQVVAWGQLFRSICPHGYLGIEHNTGHIPVGEGTADWAHGGRMDPFDVVLSEFDPWGPGRPSLVAGDGVWQIAARLLGPAYRRPPDQPVADDPHPPWYLVDCSRGPRYAIAFETDTYWWVRNQVSLAEVQRKRDYFTALGYRYVC
jgi:hypothetical protein